MFPIARPIHTASCSNGRKERKGSLNALFTFFAAGYGPLGKLKCISAFKTVIAQRGFEKEEEKKEREEGGRVLKIGEVYTAAECGSKLA